MRISRLDINSTFPINAKISNCFATSYSYDFNGNITNLRRYDNGGNLLHSINYGYEDRRNRLGSINVTGSDISSSSYRYDALGNLITDTIESIQIDWNVIGKVKSVQTPNNFLQFAYNPFGQRQIKRTDNNTTYYIHDATGNVMGIYIKDDLTLTTKERPIYGSSRLGIMNKAVVFNMTGGLVSKSNSTIGIKEYELSDHLGNVSVVILDRKSYDGTNFFPYFKSMSDYYPFGYPISTRTFSIEPYRYGFNGQEGDGEIYGNGKSYTAEYWQYDSRLGRRWNVDKNIEYYLSKYSCLQNNPINYIDLLGDSSVVDNKGYIIHYDPKDIDLRVFMQENNKLTLIGTLGKTIDANIWFKNLLIENSEKADNIWNPVTFRNYVTEMGIWDYKYLSPINPNKKTRQHIIGIAFYRKDKQNGIGDLPETYFVFANIKGRAEDINNFHFGVVGKSLGLFSETFMLKQAGSAEMGKWEDEGKQVPSIWRPIITIKPTAVPATWYQEIGAPYGDNPIDQEWIKNGFNYYNKNRSILDKDLW